LNAREIFFILKVQKKYFSSCDFGNMTRRKKYFEAIAIKWINQSW